jgi:hypothetical protein
MSWYAKLCNSERGLRVVLSLDARGCPASS